MKKEPQDIQIEWRSPDSLTPFHGNPKAHPVEQIDKIASSITTYGFNVPIVVNPDGVVLSGHGRLEAARRLGLRQVPVVTKELGKAAEKGYRIADNKAAESSWLDEALKLELEELQDLDFDLSLTGFDSEEIEELLSGLEGGSSQGDLEADEETAAELLEQVDDGKIESRARLGEIWCLGKHRLFVGDSTDPENVKRLMDGHQAVLMATDPPYGDSWVQKAKDMQKHGYVHSHAVLHGSIESDDLKQEDLYRFLQKFLAAAKFAGDPPFPVYVWHGAKRMVFERALLEAGYLVHQPVVWVKPGFVIGRLHYHPRCEWALHGWLRGNGKCPFYGERNQSDVWEIGRENDKIHPTQKPLELFNIPIANHTRTDEIIYDPFLGSGTCLIAAHAAHRRCFGFELMPQYAEVIMQRFERLTGLTATLLEAPTDTSFKQGHPAGGVSP